MTPVFHRFSYSAQWIAILVTGFLPLPSDDSVLEDINQCIMQCKVFPVKLYFILTQRSDMLSLKM